MLVYNQKYWILLPASLAGVIIEHIGQQTRPSPIRVRGTGQTFFICVWDKWKTLSINCDFFYNSNVKLKYIFEYICWNYMNQTLVIL